MKRLEGKVAIVTGGGTGIGRGIALRFAQEGASVTIAGRRMEKLEETVAVAGEAGDNMLAVRCDVTDREQIENLVSETVAHFGGVDILVNNAGVMRFAGLDQAPDEMYELLMRTNLYGPWRMSVAVLAEMKKRGGGSIITISSVAGLQPMSGAGLYCSSKVAVQMLSRTLAQEFAAEKVRVNVICPAVVEDTELAIPIFGADASTKFLDSLRHLHPLGRNGRPSDIAAAALYLASDEAQWVTGVILPVDGGRMISSNRPRL